MLIVCAGIALAFRMICLDQRPLHTDEAVHAVKFGKLLEDGDYYYDTYEYHGPTLNFFTLIPAWFLCQRKLEEVNEYTLRMVPAIFGTCLILLMLLIKNCIQKPTLLFASMLVAISPALVFYSRYYIQEMLLVFFTFGFLFCLIRWLDSRKTGWAIGSGIFLGLMHATKETWIISMSMIIISAMILQWISRKDAGEFSSFGSRDLKNLGWLILTFFIISGLFFSSFFNNPQGIVDSFAAFSHYFNKAGNFSIHIHPWYFYLQLLTINQGAEGIWSEIFILIAGISGFIFAIRQRKSAEGRIFLFLGIYSLLLGTVYSILPYKTPWNLLQFYTGWVILAGYGISMTLGVITSNKIKRFIYLLLAAVVLQLIYQTYQLNFKYGADPSNPYVYGHTTNDIFRLVKELEHILEAQPSPEIIQIEIIGSNHDYWPLPWYFRAYPHTGWWDHVDRNHPPAPIIIASPEFKDEILEKLYELPPPGERYLFLPLFDRSLELRPQVYLEGYVRKDIWDAYISHSK